mgnify:CR=1 FL=1
MLSKDKSARKCGVRHVKQFCGGWAHGGHCPLNWRHASCQKNACPQTMQEDAHAAGPILVATLPSSLSGTEYVCIDLCVETHPEWQAENVCVWYRRLPGAETEVFAMQESCPHAGISLVESDIEDFRSTDLGTSLQGPCIACPAHAFVFDAGSGRCLTNPSTPNARTHSAGGTRSCYACPLPLLGRLAFARLPCNARLPAARAPAIAPCDPGRYPAWAVATPRHIEVFVRPTPNPRSSSSSSSSCSSSTQASISREVTNAIQLAMVERALRRRYGDEAECACESEP